MVQNTSSRLKGFYNQTLGGRLEIVAQHSQLTSDERSALEGALGLDSARADLMVENVVGRYALPLGIATNFVVNGRDVLVPMVIEEPSVIAGASLAAKLAREGGGYVATVDAPVMIGQIQVAEVPDPWSARVDLLRQRDQLLELANQADPVLVTLGGGARDLEVRILEDTPAGPMLVVHLLYDVRDAMGANAINTACERISQSIAETTGGRVWLRILSNLADRRLARARVLIPEEALAFAGFSGEDVARGIEMAWAFASADPYRAATHNKGIMNGIDAVVLATGNDWRAIEAGAHAYAARCGSYTSLSTWRRDGRGNLAGTLELPLALGTVGGATRVHPTAQVALKIMDVHSARALAEIVVSVGLAQNLAALRALATEGIQKGHMSLHARQVAIAAGAVGEEIPHVAGALAEAGTVRIDIAQKLLSALRSSNAALSAEAQEG